jgi:hypothetical protein
MFEKGHFQIFWNSKDFLLVKDLNLKKVIE